MTVAISNDYSYTDNLRIQILFGDYNINLLGAIGRRSIDISTANNEFSYDNETEATRKNGENIR